MTESSQGVHVVVPSLSAPTEQLALLQSIAASSGATFVVVANSEELMNRVESAGIPFITSRGNDGFSASVNSGARAHDWEWLVVLNDDIQPNASLLTEALRSRLGEFTGTTGVVHLDAEHERNIPGVLSTLGNVSMVTGMLYRIGWHPRPGKLGTYRSFSAVAVRRDVWDAVGGMREQYGFTFEDSDFARRARTAGFQNGALEAPAAVHHRSVTTSRWVAEVLPVSAFSALEYLSEWYGRRRLMRLLLLFALAVRLPLMMLRPRRSSHFRGIVRAVRAVARDQRPSLPSWRRPT